MLGPGEERVTRWDSLIISHLEKIYTSVKYVKIHSYIMMGICSLLYGRTDVVGQITNVKSIKIKTGFKGVAENKGAVIIRYLTLTLVLNLPKLLFAC